MNNTLKKTIICLSLIIAAAAQCGVGESACYTTRNGLQCYLPGQYTCEVDDYTGDTLLAAAGTKSCNNKLYATCAYNCVDGELAIRSDRTCPAPPSCGSDLACGEACYNPEQFCCINSVPTLLAQCPAVFPTTCSADSQGCNVTFAGIGQLADGQIRQNFGAGALEVSFSFENGRLYDNKGQVCYVTRPETQVQCNYNAQFDTADSFCLYNDATNNESYLSYNGTTLFYACAVGTGGYNIYTTQQLGVYCQPIFIELDTQTCPEVPVTSSSEAAPTTSSAAAPTTSSEAAPTTSSAAAPTTSSEAAPTTSSTFSTSSAAVPTTSTPCTPVTFVQQSACANSNPARDLECCIGDGLSLADGNFCGTQHQCAGGYCGLTGKDGENCPYDIPTTSAALPTTSSAALPTTSSAAAPTTSSAAAPTTSSTQAAPTTSSAAAPTTSSTKAAPTTSSTKAATTSSTKVVATTSAPNTCVNKPRPVPWCFYDFDFDFDVDYKPKSKCTDRSNKGHHGTFFGQPKGVSALWKLAANFFGSGLQYINIPNSDDLGNQFTVATYIKFDALGESVVVANTSAWSIQVCAKSGKIYFHADKTVSWDVTFTTGVYIHIAVSVDASGNVRCYKDGQQCGAVKQTRCQKHRGAIHACKHKGSFKGSFDDFFIFDYCLNINEIISCRDKEKDQCATVTTAKPTLTKASTSSTKAATSSSKAATSSVAPKPSTSKDCEPTKPKTSSAAPKPSTSAAPKPSTSAAPKPSNVVPTPGPKHCGVPWFYSSCDKPEHSKCNDDSGHGNHGSWFGPVPNQCGGKIRNGLTFSGFTHQAITVPKCELAQSFSFTSWIKPQLTLGSCKLASTKTSVNAAAGWELEFNSISKVLTFYASGTSKATWDCKDVSLGQWAHLAVSVDNDKVEAYVNGVSKGQKSVSKCSQGGSLWIGNNASKGGQFAGSLDEVCLFDKPLSADQVVFARDTYNNVQKSSWSSSVTADWGAHWEKSNLSGVKLDRFAQWWNTQ